MKVANQDDVDVAPKSQKPKSANGDLLLFSRASFELFSKKLTELPVRLTVEEGKQLFVEKLAQLKKLNLLPSQFLEAALVAVAEIPEDYRAAEARALLTLVDMNTKPKRAYSPRRRTPNAIKIALNENISWDLLQDDDAGEEDKYVTAQVG